MPENPYQQRFLFGGKNHEENPDCLTCLYLLFLSGLCIGLGLSGENRDGQLIYLDKDSVIESYGEVAGWQKNVKSDGSWVLYRVSVQERNQSIAITSCVVYDAEGNVVDQYTSPIPIYNPVVPDSVGEGVYNFLVEIAKSNV